MLLAWLLLGFAFLCLESGLLTLSVKGNSGKYVSPVGALRYDLLNVPITKVLATWPWEQVSAVDIVEDVGKGVVGGTVESLGSDTGGVAGPLISGAIKDTGAI